MILSRYTDFITDKDGNHYLFSCLTRKWLALESRVYELLADSVANIDRIRDIHPELFDVLKKEKFIFADDSEDMREGVKYVENEYLSTENLVITINPTLDCNLRCWYCYEKRHERSIMSEAVMNNTVSWISSVLKGTRVRSLCLSFFGGEPLLRYKEVIRPLIKEISGICDETKTALSLHFTTNGILINDKMLQEITSYSSEINFQIAFDGGRKSHDSVKSLENRASCYDISMGNVRKALNAGCNVTIRCNYDIKTLPSFMEVIKDLQDLHSNERLRFNFQRIWQENIGEELIDMRRAFTKKIYEQYNGIKTNLRNLLGNSLYRCYADKRNNMVINYDGLLFRCTARDFTEKNSIGKLTANGCEFKPTNFSSLSKSGIPFGKVCMHCRILPICPNCAQVRYEHGDKGCPTNTASKGVAINIKSAFHDLSGIPIDIEQTNIV